MLVWWLAKHITRLRTPRVPPTWPIRLYSRLRRTLLPLPSLMTGTWQGSRRDHALPVMVKCPASSIPCMIWLCLTHTRHAFQACTFVTYPVR
jgi:hypothetical protein